MKRFLSHVSNYLRSTQGQTLVEYALILMLIAMVVIFMLMGLGQTVNSTYSKINTGVVNAAGQ
ncbi:Flp family type IVb pilin [Geobacter luticola]|uniref:Flp family type IVb pilin n=2 Tax=Geomobilimonas luticola TaxID=1114878 RepID=A0ABS5SE97_9BACT|nr:Flp family type IVb pilin [Geomobilimonas luticola]